MFGIRMGFWGSLPCWLNKLNKLGVFAVEMLSQALPAKNTSGLSQKMLSFIHRMAPFLMVLIDTGLQKLRGIAHNLRMDSDGSHIFHKMDTG